MIGRWIVGLLMIAAMPAHAAPAPAAGLILEGEGLLLPTGKRIRFGARTAEAVALATAALGPPVKRGTYPDCGQGIPIGHVHYRGGIELSSIAGRFVGWTVDAAGEHHAHTPQGITIGSTYAQVKRAYRDVDTDAMDDAVTFTSEGASGFLKGRGPSAKVVSLHSGQTCIVD